MCSTLLSNYVEFLNGGNIPTVLTFELSNCKGSFTPSTSNGTGFVSNTYTEGQTVALSNGMKSIYIPLNVTHILVTSSEGSTSNLYGPYVNANTDMLTWQVSTDAKTWAQDKPVSFKIVSVQNWNLLIREQCLGRTIQVNGLNLLKYQGQTEACDKFMTNYCTSNINATECGCFLAQQTHTLKDTGVACVSQDCVGQRTYKTKAMLERPCNQTLCQQIIKSDPNNDNLIQVNSKIYCNSNYFDKDTQEPSTKPNQVKNTTTNDVQTKSSTTNIDHVQNLKATSKRTPWYTWVIVAIASILFIVLAVLIYRDVLVN